MPDQDMEQRLEVVERLTVLFRFERMVYMCVSLASLLVLLAMAIMLIVRQGPTKDVFSLFGPTGVITFSTARLLRMWHDALDRIVPSGVPK